MENYWMAWWKLLTDLLEASLNAPLLLLVPNITSINDLIQKATNQAVAFQHMIKHNKLYAGASTLPSSEKHVATSSFWLHKHTIKKKEYEPMDCSSVQQHQYGDYEDDMEYKVEDYAELEEEELDLCCIINYENCHCYVCGKSRAT